MLSLTTSIACTRCRLWRTGRRIIPQSRSTTIAKRRLASCGALGSSCCSQTSSLLYCLSRGGSPRSRTRFGARFSPRLLDSHAESWIPIFSASSPSMALHRAFASLAHSHVLLYSHGSHVLLYSHGSHVLLYSHDSRVLLYSHDSHVLLAKRHFADPLPVTILGPRFHDRRCHRRDIGPRATSDTAFLQLVL
jgi:hypothetical protein